MDYDMKSQARLTYVESYATHCDCLVMPLVISCSFCSIPCSMLVLFGREMLRHKACCRNFIVPMDLEFFMPPEKIAQALKVLDVDGDGKISLADMRDAVIQVHLCTL